jgi:hypothetical protein
MNRMMTSLPGHDRRVCNWLVQGRVPGPSIIRCSREYAIFLAQHHGYLIMEIKEVAYHE